MSPTKQPLAIVGIGCRFPGGVTGVESYWQLLVSGTDAITEAPPERWNLQGFYSPDGQAPGKTVSRWGGFLNDPELFDAQFFGISPREAAAMDPQQRWLLEVAWEALEDAGIAAERIRGTAAGVFIGISNSDYGRMLAHRGTDGAAAHPHATTGTALSIAANRISYALDLRGPSLAVDTACSASLTAVHLACQSLWRGESALALAGGVNALLSPESTIGFSAAGMLSPTGRCRAFDGGADGYVRSEGAAIVVLKPLGKALADGDHVYALIRNTAANQDGRTSSLPVPSAAAQAALIEEACRGAGVAPASLSYVEAHGTGTAVGDPIEAAGIGAALSAGRAPQQRCWLGSVKTQIGHLEPASGIAGLIKVALMVERDTVVPDLHFAQPNPHIDFAGLGLEVPVATGPLRRLPGPLRAGVSSFGFGGANAHALLEEAPAPATAAVQSAAAHRPLLLPISARSEPALRELAQRWSDRVSASPPEDLARLCASAALRRTRQPFRAVVRGTGGGELIAGLQACAAGRRAPTLYQGRVREGGTAAVVFVFCGQGTAWAGMERELLAEPVFAERFADCVRLIEGLAGWSLPERLGSSEAERLLRQTETAQPALWALQMALVALWQSRGVRPAAVIGHSVGEIAAACCAGSLSLAEGARLTVARSRLQQRTSGKGGLLAVSLAAEALAARLGEFGPGWEIAAVNAPAQVTVAATPAVLADLELRLSADRIPSYRLAVDCAFHSSQMDPLREELLEALKEISPRLAAIPCYSTVTGAALAGPELTADYWWHNLRAPVRFAEAVALAAASGATAWLEIGPHPALASLIAENLRTGSAEALLLPSLRRHRNGHEVLADTLAALDTAGIPVDWRGYWGLAADGPAPWARLPGHPWQHRPFWDEPEVSRASRAYSPLHPLLHRRLPTEAAIWETRLDVRLLPYLGDHRVQDRLLFPGAAHAEMALACQRLDGSPEAGACGQTLEDLEFLQPLALSGDRATTVQLLLDRSDRSFAIYGNPGAVWQLHARGRLSGLACAPDPANVAWWDDCQAQLSASALGHDRLYAEAERRGYRFGPSFRTVSRLAGNGTLAYGELQLPETVGAQLRDYVFHPAALDGCWQCAGNCLLDTGEANPEAGLVPAGLARLQVFRPLEGRLWVKAQLTQRHGGHAWFDLEVCNAGREAVARMGGLHLRVLKMAAEDKTGSHPRHYRQEWREQPLETAAAGRNRWLEPGRWLVFSRPGDWGGDLAEWLRQQGHSPLLIRPGETCGADPGGNWSIAVHDPAGYCQLLEWALPELAAGQEKLAGIVFLWGLQECPADPTTDQAADDYGYQLERAETPLALVYLIQALAARGLAQTRLWIVTAGAIQASAPAPALTGGALWGFGRVVANEFQSLQLRMIDFDADRPRSAFTQFIDELWALPEEAEVAWYGGKRQVNRLAATSLEALPERWMNGAGGATPLPFQLESAQPGLLSRLAWRRCDRAEPAPDEVQIQVAATALNFRDVLKALGLYPSEIDDCGQLGDECAGRVIAVGEAVTRFRPGDEVMALAPHAFRAYLNLAEHRVLPKPPGVSLEQAAGLPVAFLTAYWALHRIGRLQKGERVLIHAGAGGVGQAAIQIAQSLGAEIYATAGSEEKRDFLRSQGLPAVFDSRSLAFADEILGQTGGRGVDVVLNALAGEFIDRSLAVLAPGGRFLELGKRDIYRNRKLGLGCFKRNISFAAIDLAALLREPDPALRSALAELHRLWRSGELRPPPHQVFAAAEVAEAFRWMSQARHIGKVVVSLDRDSIPVYPPASGRPRFSRSATYLVVGGLGGAGLRTAQWLAEHGAGQLLLVGRSGQPPADTDPRRAEACLEAVRAAGAKVLIRRCDVSHADAVAELLAEIRSRMPPLRGVVHAAMVLEDRLLSEQTAASFLSVYLPKLVGAWNLHWQTRELPLDFFVLYSSLTAAIGTPGQANYAAANAGLQALARYRRARGLEALCIDWGMLDDAGYMARHPRLADILRTDAGIQPIPLQQALTALGGLLQREVAQIGFFGIDWRKAGRMFAPALRQSLLSEVLSAAAAERGGAADHRGLQHQVLAAGDGDALALLLHHLRVQVAQVLGAETDTLDAETPLRDLGLDSLMAFQLKMQLDTAFGVNLQPGEFVQVPSLRGLAEVVLRLMRAAAQAAE